MNLVFIALTLVWLQSQSAMSWAAASVPAINLQPLPPLIIGRLPPAGVYSLILACARWVLMATRKSWFYWRQRFIKANCGHESLLNSCDLNSNLNWHSVFVFWMNVWSYGINRRLKMCQVKSYQQTHKHRNLFLHLWRRSYCGLLKILNLSLIISHKVDYFCQDKWFLPFSNVSSAMQKSSE